MEFKSKISDNHFETKSDQNEPEGNELKGQLSKLLLNTSLGYIYSNVKPNNNGEVVLSEVAQDPDQSVNLKDALKIVNTLGDKKFKGKEEKDIWELLSFLRFRDESSPFCQYSDPSYLEALREDLGLSITSPQQCKAILDYYRQTYPVEASSVSKNLDKLERNSKSRQSSQILYAINGYTNLIGVFPDNNERLLACISYLQNKLRA